MFVCLTLEIKRSPMGRADSLGTFGVTLEEFWGHLTLFMTLKYCNFLAQVHSVYYNPHQVLNVH